MTMDLAEAVRAATQLTQAGQLMDATRAIQAALAGRETADAGRDEATSHETAKFPHLIEHAARPGARARKSRPLGEVVGTLRELKLRGLKFDGLPGAKVRRAPEIPDGAQFLTRSFSGPAGTRAYKLYVPRQVGPKPPLLVMLHGCTQDADDFASGTRMNTLAEEHGLLVAYPIQSKAANPSACWNWFNPRDQGRDAGEPAILAGMTGAIMAEYDVDPRRVFIAGLSAGGAMAAVMGETHPDLYAAIGVHSGLAYGSANDVVTAFAAMRGETTANASATARLRTIIFHGDADRTVHPSNAGKILEAQLDARTDVRRSEPILRNGGRGAARTVVRNRDGRTHAESWLVRGAGHAWSGGSADGTYTDPKGPDASREMLRFFLDS